MKTIKNYSCFQNFILSRGSNVDFPRILILGTKLCIMLKLNMILNFVGLHILKKKSWQSVKQFGVYFGSKKNVYIPIYIYRNPWQRIRMDTKFIINSHTFQAKTIWNDSETHHKFSRIATMEGWSTCNIWFYFTNLSLFIKYKLNDNAVILFGLCGYTYQIFLYLFTENKIFNSCKH